jgi:hypothetical protein
MYAYAPYARAVVITNESQWEGSEGALLKRDAFLGQVPSALQRDINSLLIVLFAVCLIPHSELSFRATNMCQLEAPWEQFANALQRRFLLATRQDPMRPRRSLSAYDLQYFNLKFFGTSIGI